MGNLVSERRLCDCVNLLRDLGRDQAIRIVAFVNDTYDERVLTFN